MPVELPEPIAQLADALAAARGVRAVAAVAHWTAQASAGRFEIDGLPGYVAGIPTYSLAAEAASCLVVRGTLAGSFDVMAVPDALAEMGPTKWRFNRDFSLYHAAAHAARGNVAATVGQVARAALEEAHARCCAGRRWVLNEKHLMAAADMGALDRDLLARPVLDDLATWVDAVRASLLAS